MQKPGLFGMNGVLIFLLSFLCVTAYAQQSGNLILIDAENKQAFTVRIGDELYSSSSHGHLVLSHLRDSSYRLNLRFPKKNISEQVFPVTVHQKDLGFQLKGSDTTWQLYNWQSRETIHAVSDMDSSRILDRGVKRIDGFSQLMAAVVNDTSVMYNTYTPPVFHADTAHAAPGSSSGLPASVAAVQTSQTAVISPAVPVSLTDKKHLKDSLAAVNKAIAVARKDSIQTARKVAATLKDSLAAAGKTAAALRKDSLATAKKLAAASRDSLQNSGSTTSAAWKDTIRTAVAPGGSPPPVTVAAGRTAVIPGSETLHPTPRAGVKKLREVSLKISRKIVYLDTGKDGLTDTVTVFVYFETWDSLVKKQAPAPPVPVAKKSLAPDSTAAGAALTKNKPAIKTSEAGCSQLATDADLESLRSAILTANSEQEKIAVASGAFAMKCFTVGQIRVLAGLFVSDKARYHLMDAAHQHIADHDHFRELADMYTDKNFQKKFLQMADKRS